MTEEGRHHKVLRILRTLSSASPSMETIFTQGACYRLYELLKRVFDEAVPYYDRLHVITRIGDRFYDITGEVEPNASHRPMDFVSVAQAESASVCYLTVTNVNNATWPTRDEMIEELKTHTTHP